MDMLLILGGLLLIFGGLAWLIVRAFSVSLFWGVGSLLPPITLIFMLLKWRRASNPATLVALGFIPVIVGLAMLANRDSERLDAILRLDWLRSEVQQASEWGIRLHGELNGQSFTPHEGELIGGVLILRERRGALVQRELRIHLSHTSFDPLHINILPEDQGQLPFIEISESVRDDEPKRQHLAQGYTLHLKLEPQAPNLLVGNFHLVLPERFRTNLSGRVELLTDGLRYRNEKVDTHSDSKDGLHGWRIGEDQFLQLAVSGAKAADTTDTTLRSSPALKPVDRRRNFSLQRLQFSPAEYQQLRMRIVTTQESIATGSFTGVDGDGRLILQHRLAGGGGASYKLSLQDIQSIELLDP